ncbi:hypothetical protein FRC10_010295 [Ceratobasidium sp. 414]|nr:hypothetical protein FRC10_010295 [Ceratobasidium sp. 414]
MIDKEVERQAKRSQPLCERFMQELAKPRSYFDDEAQSPGSELFTPHSPDQDNEWPLAGEQSPQDNSLFDPPGDIPEGYGPFIQVIAPQPSPEADDPEDSPEPQPDTKPPGPEPVKPEVKVETSEERAPPRDDPEPPLDMNAKKANQLSQEASKLVQRFGSYGNVDDLDGAFEAYGQAAELLAPAPEALDVSSYLNLGRAMRVKFEAFYDIKDLDSAFDGALLIAHDVLQSTPTNGLYHDVLHELGAASLDRYLYDATEVAGDEAQRYCALALNAKPLPSGPKRAETSSVLSRLHLARFEYRSRAEDAVSALEFLDAAVEADPALDGEAMYMQNRARELFACYRTRRPEYTGFLNQALALTRQARDLTPPVTIQHPIASTFLAELLLARYELSHGQPDLDEALELLERAVRQVPYVRPEQPWVGERLARALLARFANQGAREDLNDGISFLEIALKLTVTNPYRRQACLDAFGGALTLRFRYLALGEELTGDDTRELMAGVGSM